MQTFDDNPPSRIGSAGAARNRRWWTLAAVCTGVFMLLLDITIVNVALPDIEQHVRRVAVRPAVGDQRVRADARRVPAHRRLARRPVRQAAALRERDRDLHRRLALLRRRDRLDLPRGRARRPGRRRSDHVRDVAGAARPGVPGPGPRDRARALRRDHGHRGRDRPGARRRDHDRPLLALDLLRQRPDRDRRARDHAAARRRVAEPGRQAARLGGLRHLQRRRSRGSCTA